MIGDKAFDADSLIDALNQRGITPVIPPKDHRKTKRACDFALYCERNLRRGSRKFANAGLSGSRHEFLQGFAARVLASKGVGWTGPRSQVTLFLVGRGIISNCGFSPGLNAETIFLGRGINRTPGAVAYVERLRRSSRPNVACSDYLAPVFRFHEGGSALKLGLLPACVLQVKQAAGRV